LSGDHERPILAQPERVRASRTPALAVLAIGAVLLVVLVGVLPRLNAQPAPTNNGLVAQATDTQLPTTPPSFAEPTISGCGSAPHPDVPRVIDETGLVEQCISWTITAQDSGAISVRNPEGNERQLEVSWDGSICQDFTSLTFRRARSQDGFELVGQRLQQSNDFCQSVRKRLGVRVFMTASVKAASVSASLGAWSPGSPPPDEPDVPAIAELATANWKLSAEAHPTVRSTQMSVLVFDPDCSVGLRDPGQVQDPIITYTYEAITVTFPVLKVRRPECAAKSAVPMTIHLSEPLGDRQLIDGGGGTFTYQVQGSLAAVSQERSQVKITALERARGQVEDRACVTTINLDRRVPDANELEAIVKEMGPATGNADEGRAWLGTWDSAARYFGAIETYTDGVNYHAIVASPFLLGLAGVSPDAYVLTELTGLSIGGSWLWYPSFNFRALPDATVFTPAPCG
jgi:hypothetical protein